jgi:dienelactone hydrolase
MIVVVSGKGNPQLKPLIDMLRSSYGHANIVDFQTGPEAWRADVVAYLRENAHGRLILIGHSWGSGTLFTAAPHVGKVDLLVSLDGCRNWTEHSEFVVTPNIAQCVSITGDFTFPLVREPIKGKHFHYKVKGGHVGMTKSDDTIALVELLIAEALK